MGKDLFQTIEEAERDQKVADADQVLTDEALHTGGLRPVKVWARTSASKNALRVAKHKEKMEAEGVKQLNVRLPMEAHDTFKRVSAAMVEGKTMAEAFAEVAPEVVQGVTNPQEIEAVKGELQQRQEEVAAARESAEKLAQKVVDLNRQVQDKEEITGKIQADLGRKIQELELALDKARAENLALLISKDERTVIQAAAGGGWKAKAIRWLAGL